MDIDIRIMGVSERIGCIQKNQKLLNVPDENVFIDTDFEGCQAVSRKAWLKPTKKSHIMVLQDDVELCKDFLKYCNVMIKKFPKDIISLFPFQFRTYKDLAKYPPSPYVETMIVSGAALIMDAKMAKKCVSKWDLDLKSDDANIQFWARDNKVRIITTIPSIVQHLEGESFFNANRNHGGTVFYDPDPCKSKWGSDIVTHWEKLK